MQTTHAVVAYAAAIDKVNKLILSDSVRYDSTKEVLALYARALRTTYLARKTGKTLSKLVDSQTKLNDMLDIGIFAAKLDANL